MRTVLLLLFSLAAGCSAGDSLLATASPWEKRAARPVTILMIGDGMGPEQLRAASLFAHGAPDRLFLERLPVRGEVRTASLSGITDSAAAATAMATGALTYNGRVGVNEHGAAVESLVELAHRHELAAGIVTTASLPHATPGAFSAHRMSRHDLVGIAEDQALRVQPELLLGGGRRYYAPAGPGSVRDDVGLLDPMRSAGYEVAMTASELRSAAESAPRLIGLFADDHLDYVIDRGAETTQPTLAEMTDAALTLLDRDPNGFFLVVEGARIDMASHGNDLERAVYETLAFDQAVRLVAEWAATQNDVTLVVTADHECGGLRILEPRPAGQLPLASWRWGDHTNTSVGLFGLGARTHSLHGRSSEFRDLHAVLAADIAGTSPAPVAPRLVADGDFADLRTLVATQTVASGFGAGWNQLDALYIDSDERVLAVGLEGLFQWRRNALLLLIDVDYGSGSGHPAIAGAVTDARGDIDQLLSSAALTAPADDRFAADFALVTRGGAETRLEELTDRAGLRGLQERDDLAWHAAVATHSDRSRPRAKPLTATPGRGLELHIPWSSLFRSGAPPPGTTIAISAVLVNDDGGYTSNQALPPFPPGTDNPGRTPVPLPGVARFTVP